MLVRDRMTPNPYTIQLTASASTLISFMKEKNLRKVPVLDGEKLVGLVTDKEIEKVSPSLATSLSVYEINYLLSKVTVADAMVRDVVSCSPDESIEDAALLMRERRINSLLVTEGGKLVGIVTDSDLFEALIDMMGGRIPGTKYVLRVDNVPGVLERIGRIISREGINISHFSMVQGGDKALLYLRVSGDSDPDTIRRVIETEGFEIVSVAIKG